MMHKYENFENTSIISWFYVMLTTLLSLFVLAFMQERT